MTVEGIALWLIAAFCAAAALLSFFPGKEKDGFLKRLTASLWLCACAFALILFCALIVHLVSLRFEFRYVAEHTDSTLPLVYRISALWAGQEGSFLLWLVTLLPMGFMLLRRYPSSFCVFALISLSLAAMTAVSDPFARSAGTVSEGAGLALALQNPWMAVHPPLVFVGYSALAVLASLAASSDAPEAALRRTVRVGFLFLGLGIFTGSVWAYRALGWGGFWAWDPIENAALVPWLILCAYLHDPKPVNRVKRIAPFALACLGTFLARSGVLADASAHAYVSGNAAATVILIALLAAALIFGVVLALRHKKKKAAKRSPAEENRSETVQTRPLDLSLQNPVLGMRVFARITYGYAGLILIGTLLPLLTGAPTPTFAYDALTIAFALACCALLLLRHSEIIIRKGLLVMFISTALVFALMFVFNTSNAAALILLWFFLLPLALFASGSFKLDFYSFTHVALTLLFIGALCANTLGISELAVYSPSDSVLYADGRAVQTALPQAETAVVSTPLADYVVHSSQAISTGIDSLIPYESKPLIRLFWIGGFGMLGMSAVRLLAPAFQKKKKQASYKKPNYT